jgi:hypothetical protein
MKAENPNSTLWQSYQRRGVSRALNNFFSFFFFCFGLGLLFCRLLWSDFSELVLVMEHDLGYSMDILYELCESRLWWRIGGSFQGNEGRWKGKKIYKAG